MVMDPIFRERQGRCYPGQEGWMCLALSWSTGMPVALPCLVSMTYRETATAWKWHSDQELQHFRNDGVAHIQPGKLPGPVEVLAKGRGSLEWVVEREMVSISFSSEIRLS